MSDRAAILLDAMACITVDRSTTHGPAEDSFGRIAALWSADMGIEFTPHDVVRLMILLKVARAKWSPHHADHAVDICGYGAILGEMGAVRQ